MKCLLKVWHLKPAWRNDDKESETVIEEATPYKTKKDAEAAIERKINECERRGYKIRGSKKKGYSVYTGNKWQNEGTGDMEEEMYIYEIVKPE